MIVVKTLVKESNIQGLGLFADEDISKGTPVWIYDARFDISFEPKEVERLDSIKKEFVMRYAYLSTSTGKYVLCADDGRFINHSSIDYNLENIAVEGELETRGVAVRDIMQGEEILVNYREIDMADAGSDEEYLNN